MNRGITVEQLYDLRDRDKLDEKSIEILDSLLQAITDWPTEADSVGNFLLKVQVFLNIENLTTSSIQHKIKTIDPKLFLWQVESITSLLEVLKMNKDQDIETTILTIADIAH